MAILVLTRSLHAGRRISVSLWPATIGRDTSNHVSLDDDRASRHHARIKKRDRLYVIEDLDSKNGTYVNGDRVSNATLQSGDKILIGDTELVFMTPEAQIDVVTEMLDFEHVLSQDLGLDKPIEIGEPSSKVGSQAKRLSPVPDGMAVKASVEQVRTIFEHHANVLEAANLDEAAASLLKGTHAMLPNTSRSALFLWSNPTRRLLPIATRSNKKKSSFLFSQRAMEDVVSRKHGILMNPNSPDATQSSRHRMVLPIMAHEELVAILHVEADEIQRAFVPHEIECLQLFLLRAASVLENYVLRRDLDNYMVGMIETMIATLEAKDTYTHGHSERVSRYCMAIADEMKLSRDVKKILLISSLCHDIGKIGIPDAILRKAALLNPDEYEEMKQHPVIGANIISHVPNAKRFLSGVKYHHEKWDGSGYPDGLKGEDIPFFGRIVAVSDVFDAMISGRSYSGFMDASDAVEQLSSEQDLFDPDILKAFAKAFESGNLTQKTSTRRNKVES